MAIIQNNRPLSLLEQLLNPAQNGPTFGQQIGQNINQHFANQQAERMRQLEFQQQNQLLQQKERQRAQQGAAMANLLGGATAQRPGMTEGQAGPQQPQEPKSFADRDFRDIAREALENGFDQKQVMDLKKLHEESQNRKEDIELKKESHRIQQEAPARKELEKRLTHLKDLGKKSREEAKQYRVLRELMANGEARSGLFGRMANATGIGNIFKTPTTQIIEKTVSQINSSKLTDVGAKSVEALNEIRRGQLSTNMDPESFDYIARVSQNSADANNIFIDELERLETEYADRGEQKPLNIERMAEKNVKPQLDAIWDDSLKALSDFNKASAPNIISKKGNTPIKIPKDTMYGELLINPKNSKQRDIYVGNGNVIPEEQFKMLEENAPAAQNKGQEITNKKLGLTFVSDGKRWNVV